MITDTVFGVNGGNGPDNLRRGKAKYDIGHFEDTPEYVREVCVPTIEWGRDNAKRVAVTVGTLCLWMYPPSDALGCYFTPANPSRGKWGFNVCSPILYYGKDPYAARQPNGTTMTENAEKLGHPCPKPIKAWTWLVNRASKPGELVLDPFAGSGTTLLACKRNGRRAIGIEINERYCEIIARRLSQEMTLVPQNAEVSDPGGPAASASA